MMLMRWNYCTAMVMMTCALAAPRQVTLAPAPANVEAYDFVEATLNVTAPDAANPFTDVAVSGSFGKTAVEGFCDSADGSVYRIRFMPSAPGDYAYTVTFRQGAFEKTFHGSFHATAGHRRGPVRVDAQYPWHFVWEGTGEHYFFNGTTAFWMMGWRDDRVIDYSIERLHKMKINRIRVLIAGRTNMFYGEPVMTGENFTVFLTPWPAENTQDFLHPGFDYARFNVDYWRKYERMLRFARDRDVILSLILDLNDNKVHPGAGSADEQRYIRYAIARFGAFSNITWDLGDDLEGFRDDPWTRATGELMERTDPYQHLATSHPMDNIHQDRAAGWFGFASFQEWSRTQHEFMLRKRAEQEKLGRIIPQANEEYGYEDHYPLWSKGPGSESAEVLRRTAWEIAMAGGYGTAGESARRGTNIWPDTGGGWMNGRGDDTMVMLKGYEHMVDFFTSFEWWKTNPHDELVDNGAYCVAEPGRTYAVYLPKGGGVTVKLGPGHYRASWFDAFSGEWIAIGEMDGPAWTSPKAPGRGDWGLLVRKVE